MVSPTFLNLSLYFAVGIYTFFAITCETTKSEEGLTFCLLMLHAS